MTQKHRISTNIGVDQKITVELKQDFDVLEILSLKFTQQDVYTSICSDYGVVCGRVTANNGFGIGNAKISIFIPLSTEDENDPVISALYPYKQTSDKNENNYRYNLLPSRQQHGGHNPTGTFPDQSDILTREEVLEVFEKYYRYTVKTNTAGDFMIWGVPVGTQTIHVDVDMSDVGCFSLRPNDFIRQGLGVDKFKNKYSFKSSEDLDSLPQVVSFDKIIQVYPFWGNESLCEIGITRTDFDLTEKGINIQPKAYVIGGIYTDSAKNAINKHCTPRRKMGRKCDMVAKSGKVEAIRFMPQKDPDTHLPYLEVVDLHEDIPDDGGFVLPLEMNMDYIFTNEFGENEITNDPNKGIPTSACYRMRINMNDNGLSRVRANADYLIPNIREYQLGSEVDGSYIDDKSYAFSTDYNDYPTSAIPLITNNVGGEYYPQDYFYRFNYNKVYTVSSFQQHYYGSNLIGQLGFANINEAHPAEEEDCGDKNTPPTNFGIKNYTFTLLIADVLLALDFVYNLVVLVVINTLAKLLRQIAEIAVGFGTGFRSLRGVKNTFIANNTSTLKLINYPECEECNASPNNGCELYDIPYDESMITGFFVGDPSVTQTITVNGESTNAESVLPANTGRRYVATKAQLKQEILNGYPLVSTAIYGDESANFVSRSYIPYSQDDDVRGCVDGNFSGVKTRFGADWGTPIGDFTLSRRSEFNNGVFYIVPGTQSNGKLIKIVREYYRRKRVGKMFCGGIVNYGFIDNWLSGSLYFFQFKVKNIISKLESGVRYCRDLVRFNVGQQRFYYRSAKFDGYNFDASKINHPTTFVDLGPRDEFIKEICIDESLDPNCSVSRNIGATSYQDLGELMGLAINYRMETAGDNGSLDLFFQNAGFERKLGLTNILDGDILQLLSINNEAGIEHFDLQDPKYIGYNFNDLDPEIFPEIYTDGSGNYGPLPVTFEIAEDGYRIRTCLNEATHIDYDGVTIVQGRLTESSQTVPFYLWDKGGAGFGPYGSDRSNQSWDYFNVQTQPLQGMTYAYNITGIPNDSSDQYFLPPMTHNFDGIQGITGNTQIGSITPDYNVMSLTDNHNDFDDYYPGYSFLYITGGTVNSPTAGTLYVRYGNAGQWWSTPWTNNEIYIHKTQNYYNGNTQILSTPFQFYFGLMAGKTGMDKFIDLFGPKGAFPPVT